MPVWYGSDRAALSASTSATYYREYGKLKVMRFSFDQPPERAWTRNVAIIGVVAFFATLAVFFVSSVRQHDEAAAKSTTEKKSERSTDPAGAGTFGDETITTLIQWDHLKTLAGAGDGAAKAKLERATVVLAQLRERAESGDVESARQLHGKLSLAGHADDALEVLRMPRVREHIKVKRILETVLASKIIGKLLRCEQVEDSLLAEFVGVLEALSEDGDTLSKEYIGRISTVADPNSAREIMKKLNPPVELGDCSENKLK